jgi:ABC-2 type transport system ATP-binding protein
MAVLEAVSLTKRYGDLTAVADLSLAVEPGEVFGLLGPNGAGKTTCIQMLCGLLRPDTGQVLIHGRPVAGGDPDVQARVGVCPQNVVLWQNATCLEQLEFIGEMYDVPRREARRRGEALLEAMGLAEKRDKLAKTLSGGMQRRLNIAMALVHDPEVLVLDEPEAGQDPQSRVLVREYIRSLARKKTVILTTHNMDEAERLVDRVAIIDHGHLLALDTPEQLKRQAGPGDVLELELPHADAAARAALAGRFGGACESGNTLVIRARNVVEQLPAVLDAVRSAGLAPGEIRLRENSLEDVFIAMTGRRLRE